MRENKFRVWDKESKCWIGRYSHDWIGSGAGNICSYDEQPWKCMSFEGKIMSNDNMGGFVDSNQEIYIIQQFTGLKDKNGKEIYEGDIIEYIYPEAKYDNGSRFIVEAINAINPCLLTPILQKDKDRKYRYTIGVFLGQEHNHIKIIGNIFETPDLLKS